jgi:hypothetical protein
MGFMPQQRSVVPSSDYGNEPSRQRDPNLQRTQTQGAGRVNSSNSEVLQLQD